MKNLFPQQPLPKQQQSFEARQMEHLGNNPIHEQHLQKALGLKQPKQQMAPGVGSPWLKMGNK